MTARAERRFSDAVMSAVSSATRESLDDFAEFIRTAELVLREYHVGVPSAFISKSEDPMAGIRQNARLIHTMTWTKAILYSRAVVDSVNDGNLLMAFQALRAYVELVAAVRFTLRQMQPHIYDGSEVDEDGNRVNEASVSPDEARLLNHHMEILLHGGRFNWKAYFEEGTKGIIDRKRVKRAKEEKAKFEENSLRIGPCIKDWGKESPEVEFVYDYLCDVVHPNKGSNLVLLIDRHQELVFDAEGRSGIGMVIFEGIFPRTAYLCMRAMAQLQPVFMLLGAEETYELWTRWNLELRDRLDDIGGPAGQAS
jgi:hypothetical protein